MRTLWMTLCAVGLAAFGGAGSFGQTAATGSAPVAASASDATVVPPLPKEPAEIFAAATPFYDVDAPSLKPWHVKMSYQLYDEKGIATETGTYERWWVGPQDWRTTLSRGGAENSVWNVAGQRFVSQKGLPPNYFERQLRRDWLTPFPTETKSNASQFELKEQKVGQVKMTCVSQKNQYPGESFCFDPSYPMLRAHIHEQESVMLFNNIVRVQGLFVPKSVSISNRANVMLRGTLETINAITASAPELVPSSEATKLVMNAVVRHATGGQLESGGQPAYPAEAKFRNVHGVVTLEALIGIDGKVRDVTVISGPDPGLEEAAKEAVRKWRYKPFIIDGSPAEVNTMVHIQF